MLYVYIKEFRGSPGGGIVKGGGLFNIVLMIR